MSVALSVCVLTLLTPAASPPASHPWVVEADLSGDQLVARTKALDAAGYRAVSVSGYNVREDARFGAVWEKAKGPAWTLDYGLTPPALDRRISDLKGKGYRPVVLSGYDLVGTQGFADLWQKRDGPLWQAEYGLDAVALQRGAGRMKDQGYRPVSISSYVSGSFTRYAVISEKSDVAWRLSWGLSAAAFNDALNDLSGEGYRPVALSGLGVELQDSFACVWEKRKGQPWLVRVGLDAAGLADLARLMRLRQYRPLYLTSYGTLQGTRYGMIWEKDAGK